MSVITAVSSSQNFYEPESGSAPVTAFFKLNSPLSFPAKVTVKIVPSGAEYANAPVATTTDLTGFKAYYSTSLGAGIVAGTAAYEQLTFLASFQSDGSENAIISLPIGTKYIKLVANVLADSVVENGESFQFVVSQFEPSFSLSGSTYVSSTVKLLDPAWDLATIKVNPNDTFYAGSNLSTLAENDAAGGETPAVASFQLYKPGTTTKTTLDLESWVDVSIVGNGAIEGADYTAGFTYSLHDALGNELDGTAGGRLVVDGKIKLVAGTSFFRLATTLKNDGVSETGESITFVVSQSADAVGLKDSYYVQKTFNLIDGPQTFSSAIGTDLFVATSAVDTFNVATLGASVLRGEAYDTITGFSTTGGDVINLGTTFDKSKILVLTVNNLDEASIVTLLQDLNGLDVTLGAADPDDLKGLTFVFKTGSDAYLLFDADKDGIIETNNVNAASNDTFIKLVGGASFNYTSSTNDFTT